MRRFLSALLLTALLASLGGCGDRALKAKVDAAQRRWRDDENQLRRGVRDHLANYQARVTEREGGWGRLRVTVFDGGAEVYAFDGHEETTLTRIGDVVFVADLSPIATGCAIVAFNLKAREELWRTN